MATDITKRIQNIFPTLSKNHKKIANLILHNCDKAADLTANRLAKLLDISESTVVRFANKLGFEGYQEFQVAVEELIRSSLTPNQRIEMMKKRIGRADIVECVMEADISKIRYTVDTLDRAAFNKSVDAILSSNRVYIAGARSSEPIAKILYYNLSLICDNVKFVNPTYSSEIYEQMFSICETDTLIAFSFPRYSSKMVNSVKFASDNNAKVVVFTDSKSSPLAEYATYLLTAQSDMASFMDSLVAPLSIINAIIVEITRRREREIKKRFDKLEKIWEDYDVYDVYKKHP